MTLHKNKIHPGRDGEADRSFEAVVRAMSHAPGVVQAKMFGCEGLKIKGRFFAVLVRGGLAVKLPERSVKEVIARKQGKQFFHIYDSSRIMKEWVSLETTGNDWLKLVWNAKYFVAQTRNGGKK